MESGRQGGRIEYLEGKRLLNDIQEVLVTEEEIAEKVARLGAKISEDYKDRNLLMVSILKGSVIFMADLMRRITIPARIDFMSVSSYGAGVKTSGVVKIIKDLDIPLEGFDLLIVEDILDSGLTLHYLIDILRSRNPRSVRICTLLDKPERRKTSVHPDYVGFVIPDAFVVGYGLDYAEKYRNLPFVGVLKPDVYEN
jgi:hypoxanthine phosphoribosyltransferase